ncbi:hypothetical protein SAMN05216567_10141 [Variovorax sp. OK605]|uniref:hypothetical protein n=1 Tax=Variovorax sp. OK605 TaxID=1855317 RepID=UPI0008F28B2E|nr:hypothetical protein [Variovorax sp. OK605]SFO51680.1 hypothetical protein SAMN05216567_10141 [Variovorax sp. OK605]
MPTHDSDLAPLTPTRHLPRAVRRVVESLIVISGLIGGGIAIGYYAGVQQERQARLEEIARLQESYQTALGALSGKTERSAAKVADAAASVSSAAEAVAEVAGKADSAAATAKTAARTAASAAVTAQSVSAAQEQERRAVNSAVTKANARIQERAQ